MTHLWGLAFTRSRAFEKSRVKHFRKILIALSPVARARAFRMCKV